VDMRLVNKKVFESLAKAGAFDTLAPPTSKGPLHWRARIVANLDRLVDHGGRFQRDREQGQSGLFGGDEETHAETDADALPEARPWTETEALAFEKEALGLYMSGHPLARFAEILAAAGAKRLTDMTQGEPDIAFGGVVTGLRPLKTKKGDRMCVFMLEQETAKVEAVVFPEAFSKFGGMVVDDAMLLVRGKFEMDDTMRLVVSEITPLDVIRERAVQQVEIHLNGRGFGREKMLALADVLDRYPGDRRVRVVVSVNGSVNLRVPISTARRIRPSDAFVKDVEALCGAGAVVLKS
jgi:DNA polymerase-3 subunit alpha